MRDMLVHGGLSRVLVGPCLWTVLGGGVSVCDWSQEKMLSSYYLYAR